MSNARQASPTRYAAPPASTGPSRPPFIPVDELIPFCGFLCCLSSFITKQPECQGCYSKDVCCCLYHEIICLKETTEPGYERICYRMECMQGDCVTCRQSEWQCCCYDYRCSALQIPEQPCICTILFFTCYFDNERACHCCGDVRKLKAIISKDETRASNLHQIIGAQLDEPEPARGGSTHGRSSHGGNSSHGGASSHGRPPAPYRADSEDLPEATVVSYG